MSDDLAFYGKRLDVLKKTPFSLALFDGYSHFPHQETSIHILGDSFSKFVGEGEFIVLYVRLKTIIAYLVGEMLFQFTE